MNLQVNIAARNQSVILQQMFLIIQKVMYQGICENAFMYFRGSRNFIRN
jgi:hypothetical protein